jgi:hypothetical protein
MATGGVPLYRTLHGAPMLAGVPAHYALVLMGAATLLGFGLLPVSKLVGFAVVAGVVAAWVGLAIVFGQDRAQVPLFVLRLFHRFPRKITSYCPSRQRVVVEE